MKINSLNSSQIKNSNNQPNFKGVSQLKRNAQRGFDWLGDRCNIENGSLTREMFLAVSFLFLLGARFIEARDNDERREILTRDIPAITASGVGALLLNNGVSRYVTKKTGIPITFKDKSVLNFASQKQVKDWYSNLSDVPDTLVSFSDTVDRNGGSIQKVMKKFGFSEQLEALTKASDNAGIINDIKKAKTSKSPAFKVLEDLIKNVGNDNKVLKFAKNYQAVVKLGCIALTSAFLGYFLPRLNIIITRKKCLEEQQGAKNPAQKDNQSHDVMKVSNYHSNTARQSFKNFLNMVNK